jgi:hypothetical protein
MGVANPPGAVVAAFFHPRRLEGPHWAILEPKTTHRRGAPWALTLTGMPGWLVGAGHPDPSLTRISDVKTFNTLFLYKFGT